VSIVLVPIAVPIEVEPGARTDLDERQGNTARHARQVFERWEKNRRPADIVRLDGTRGDGLADRPLVRETELAKVPERALGGRKRVVTAGRIERREFPL
jgi:hypothetical protein